MKPAAAAASLALLLAASGGPSLAIGDVSTPSRPLAFAAAPPARACHHRRRRGRPRAQLTKGWLAQGAAADLSRRGAAGVSWRGGRRVRGRVGSLTGPAAGAGVGHVGLAAAGEGPGGPRGEGVEERCIRRLGVAARRVWTDYYTNSDVRESTGSLGVFLEEATAALDGADASSEDLSRLFKAELLQTSERLDYHLDGDLPMVLYRFWNRGRAMDVYERDLLHCPRWIELVAETRRQMDVASAVVVREDMGTICYPNGDIFEGEVDSLLQLAQGPDPPATTPPAATTTTTTTSATTTRTISSPASKPAAMDAELSSPGISSPSRGFDGDESVGLAPYDVRTISGLVSLTVGFLEDGLADEAVILQRHLRSPDFGHPLLRLASPSSTDVDFPHMPDEDEEVPAMRNAEEELTEEHIALGERGAKELMHDRRRSQLDVYLICAAYRAHLAVSGLQPAATNENDDVSWQLDDEDARILDGLVSKAAAAPMNS